MVAEINGRDFQREVFEADMPVLVFFISARCNTCFALGLVINELSKEYASRIKFVKLSIEENLEVADLYGIKALPAVLFFDKSTLIQKSFGFHYRGSLKGWLEESIGGLGELNTPK